jgi:hypothetical protein
VCLHCFTFEDLHENVSSVAVSFQLDFLQTAEPDQNLLASVRLQFKLHRLDPKRLLVQFFLHDEREFDFIQTYVFDSKVLIHKIPNPQRPKVQHILSRVSREFKFNTDVKSLSLDRHINGQTVQIQILEILSDQLYHLVKLLLLNCLESYLNLRLL